VSEKRVATVRMEESYMQLTLEYSDAEFESSVCKSIVDLEQKLKIYPEVIHRRDKDHGYCTIVEFSGDEYSSNRACGTFIEEVIEQLNLKDVVE